MKLEFLIGVRCIFHRRWSVKYEFGDLWENSIKQNQ